MAAKKMKSKAKAAATTKKSAAKPGAAKSARTTGTAGETLSLASLFPSLTVNDVETSLTWYRDVLGFAVKERWERDGKLMGVELAAGKVSLMLGQDDWKKGRDRIKGQGVRMYFSTAQDINRIAARFKARGGRLTQEPKDEEWGYRDFALADPDGYMITIMTPLKKAKKR